MGKNKKPLSDPKIMGIVRLIHQTGSVNALRAAHPEISEQDIARATQEMHQITDRLFGQPAARSKRKKAQAPSGNAYQIKITLRGSKPPIWRRVVAPDLKLDQFHAVIQVAMGWTDTHLHSFEIDGVRYETPDPRGFENDAEDERRYRLSEVIEEPKMKFDYVYDFGDDWEHVILVEKILPPDRRPEVMVCLAGKGRCPFEDSGGVWGWYDKLAIVADPSDPNYEEVKEWMGEVDPEEFDLAEVNKSLAELKKYLRV